MNPFLYDKPLPPSRLVDREAELEELLERATNGTNTFLAGPRRYGKTTLLKRVLAEAENAGTPTAYVDLSGARTVEAIADAVDAAYRPLKSVPRRAMDTVRRGATGSVTLFGFGGGGGKAPEAASRLLRRTLEVPRLKQRRGGAPCVVVFDEFQNVLGLDGREEIDGLIRSVIQHHVDSVAYIFSGSEPTLMDDLFGDKKRPLYDQARPLALAPLPDSALEQFVCEQFEKTGREAKPAMPDFLGFVRGHPQRSMLLAHHLWSATGAGGTADGDTWRSALETALDEESKFFSGSWDGLQPSEKEALRAVAAEKDTPDYVVRRLTRRGEILEEEDGPPRILDPLYEAWLQNEEGPARMVDHADAEYLLDLLERQPVQSWPKDATGDLFDRAARLKNAVASRKIRELTRGEQELFDRNRRIVTRGLAEATGETEQAMETKLAAILGI